MLHKRQHLIGCFCQRGDSKPAYLLWKNILSHLQVMPGSIRSFKSFQLISRLDALNSALQISDFFVTLTTLSRVFSTSLLRYRKPSAHPEVLSHKALHQYIMHRSPLQIPRELKHPEVWGVHKFHIQVEQAQRKLVLQIWSNFLICWRWWTVERRGRRNALNNLSLK